MKVIAGGILTLYERDGKFQLNVRTLEPKGVGALQLAFEQLKKRLLLEGLFDVNKKKPIPEFPHKIALITSPAGAAIQDFMKILETRVGIDLVELFPVKVQGEEAPAEIKAAIEDVSRRAWHDVLVVTRGGGSLEDLAAFNDEGVVRALAACSIPTISAIGHEVDFTLCDFVADRREPTPTAAAAHLAPGKDEIQEQLNHLRHRLVEALNNQLEVKRRNLKEFFKTLRDRRPDLLLDQARQDLDYRAEELKKALQNLIKEKRLELRRFGDFLARSTPLMLIKPSLEKLRRLKAQLVAYHPHAPLRRGYAIVTRKKTGEILRSIKGLKVKERLGIQLEKGSLESNIVSLNPNENS
jgi:exodeoxyribonuclease VII large subunit